MRDTTRRPCRCCQRPSKPGRPLCDVCYRNGAAKRPEGIEGFDRPKKLRATGLRIDDLANVLIHPCGKREFPVPNWITSRYWLETDPRDWRYLIVKRAG